ncbi:hypothetical protein OTU49_004861, partial [Cherax quadricarinatus]
VPAHPDPCFQNPCGPFSSCRVVKQRPVCECLAGYYGAPPQCHPECLTNSDCPKYLACVNEKCVDPCVGTCGRLAQCQVVNHSPLCSCPQGYEGDPHIQCLLIQTTTPRPIIVSTPHPSSPPPEITTHPSPCTPNPCAQSAVCTPQGQYFECACLPGMFGNPYVECRAECIVDSDCARNKACERNKCVDPCKGVCGAQAECHVIMHKPVCMCPQHLTGDAYIACSPIPTSVTSTPASPVAGGPCDPSPCGQLAECHEEDDQPVCECLSGYFGDPNIACRPTCSADSQCESGHACVNDRCIDPCPGTCGINAECRVPNHIPICTCPPGYSGSPYQRCFPHEDVDSSEEREMCDACGPNADCREVGDRPVCTCRAGFIGAPPNCRPVCVVNRDCSASMACIRQKCVDPCPGACGTNAECRVINHSPVCTCIPGYTGEPFARCNRIPPAVVTTPPPSKEPDPCAQGICAANAECRIKGTRAVCTCRPGYFGNPYEQCRPECIINSQCPQYLACVKQQCKDPCPGTCGIDAICEVVNHNPVCTCPRSMTGDPFSRCEPIRGPRDPCNPTPCGPYTNCHVVADRAVCSCLPDYIGNPDLGCRPECTINSDCPLSKACINTKCVDPCVGVCGSEALCSVVSHNPLCNCPDGYTGDPLHACRPKPVVPKDPCNPTPCGPNANCAVVDALAKCSCYPGYIGNPYVECRPECTINSDCPKYLACVNQKCRDPCQDGSCGVNALCDVINHRAMCSCPRAYKGNPYIECLLDTTSRPPPIAEMPHRRPPVPTTSHPTLIPSPPPIIVGCEKNDQCNFDTTCINRLCTDICTPGLCGKNAECHTIGHRPICLCPAGTTGNPTQGCLSLVTEKPLTDLPIKGTPHSPEYDPPHPITGPVTMPLPPLAETHTTRPIQTPTTTPIPPPIVPPIAIACENSDDCTMDNSCINNLCYDVCSLGICGDDAECKIGSHRPVCSCPPGTTGDPLHECVSLLAETTISPQPPIAEIIPTQPGDPVHPITGPTSPSAPPLAEHPSPRPTPPPVTLPPPPPPTPGPLPVGCESSGECPFNNSCVNKLCFDICHPGFCGENANCQTVGHRPTCICPVGTTGNPNIKCSALAVDTPVPLPPVVGDRPPAQEIIINPVTGPTAPGLPPLTEEPKHPPTEPPITRPPPPVIVPLPVACENNDDCDMDNSCLNMMCYEVCSLGVCGEKSNCRIISHRPVCLCQPGTTGDPQEGCRAILTERPIIVAERPIADITLDREQPIQPVVGPSTPPPLPLAEAPIPHTTEPPAPLPPPIPTAPPNAVGCVSSDDCPVENSCINRLCLDICHPGFCGEAADCRTVGHRPSCVCPPGTTGNPTERCMALATEIAVTHSPMAGITVLPPGEPVIPASGPSSPTDPPLAEPPTRRPPEPTSPRPPPLPIIPPLVIACENNDDCASDNSCINNLCYDVCSLGVCGDDAECKIAKHRPVCNCPPGTTGDPLRECVSLVAEKPISLKPPIAEIMPTQPGDPVHPITGPTSPGAPPLAEHSRPRPPLPPVTLPPPPPPTPGPLPVGCESSDDCPFDNSCVNKLCFDICHPGLCGENADCETVRHHPTCTCPLGTTGNPNVKCSALAVDDLVPLPPPIVGDRPPADEIAIHPITGPTAPGLPPLVEEPKRPPTEPPVTRPPPPVIVPLVPVACENNDDCDMDNSCLNQLCYDVCSLGICGEKAECVSINHRPVCLCYPGTTGDPQEGCRAISTEKPVITTEHPIADITVDREKPIHPVVGPSTSPPLPLAEAPIPHTTEPPAPLPPPIPTAPPNAVGCVSSDDCPVENSCINRLCLDICHPGFCGEAADCRTVGHRPSCVCPPGTTGNPTERCMALATEIAVTHSPMAGITVLPPGEPVIPASGPSSPTDPPLAEPPTRRPPEPTSPRPPPLPIIPPLVIACENNDDCASDNSCINNLCYDVCSLGVCGDDAECKIAKHRPVCNCPPGTTGDPLRECVSLVAEKPISLKPPVAEIMPTQPGDPVRPITGPTSPGAPPLVEHSRPRPTLPPVTLPPPPPTPGPLPVGCESSDDCPFYNSCVNKLCFDICHPGLCGENADCETVGHRPTCNCPLGTTGNPNVKCSALAVDAPVPLHPPVVGDRHPIEQIIIHPITGPTAPGLPPLAEKPKHPTTEPPLTRPPPPPIVPLVPVACENNDDCDMDNSCLNQLCYDVCSLGICGEDADCKTLNHRPVCLCPPGTTGNPQVICSSLVTLPPETVGPIPGITSVPPSEPVLPIAASTEVPLPPLVSMPPVHPALPEPPVIPFVPTPPPLPTGCSSNDECPFDNTCVNQLCFDVCYPGLCGHNANCQTTEHRPACVCPKGTTGNPTIACIALVTESSVEPLPPLVHSTPHPPEDIMVPILPPTTPRPPPLVVMPTTTPEPLPPRPPITPILPPIVIACQNNDECPADNSCLNHICYDVCSLGICGENAECQIFNQRPVCECPTGTRGNPTEGCQAIHMEHTTLAMPTKDTPSPVVDVSVIPVAAPDHTTPLPLFELSSPRPSPPPFVTPPLPPTAPPFPVGCQSADECPYDNSCVNQLCLDICYPGLCGENAECQTRAHKIECKCPPGTTGNPTLKCSALSVLQPTIPQPPISGAHTPLSQQPLQPIAAPDSTTPSPMAEVTTTRSPEPFIPVHPPPPIIPPILIACENNDNCDIDNSCINLLCYPVCSLGICGENAECKSLDHRAVCICPSGTTGNPQHHCQALVTEVPPTLPPPFKEIHPQPKEPIMPVAAPTSPTHPPLVLTQPPQVTEPPASPPALPVTDGPLPIGCTTSGVCAFDEQCYNRLCVKVCSVQPCQTDSECIAQMHQAICTPVVALTEKPQCLLDEHCFNTQVCTSGVCREVCLTTNPCAPMAVCTAHNHRPICNCPPGYIGNPFVACRRPEPPTPPPYQPPTTPQPECLVDNDCAYNLACLNQQCQDPCQSRDVCGFNAECIVTVHTPTCMCSPGYTGNPYVRCRPPTAPILTPAPPSLKPQCTRNEDCPADRACYSGSCQNPCEVGKPCAPTALCDAIRHRALCSCPRGMSGDPHLQCTSIEVSTPQPECLEDERCSDTLACINEHCQDPCALYDNCAPNAECHVIRHRAVCSCPDGYIGNPNIQCLVAGCRSNSECPVLHACINRECEDPCKFEKCGLNAECRSLNQRAKCYCPESLLGDPYVRCERPECTSDPECPSWLACISQECRDPCNCGPGAQCRVINHRPLCTCPPDHQGDPNVQCVPKPALEPSYKECQTDGECPSKMACFDGRCDDPCQVINPCGTNAKCHVIDTLPFRTMTCECLPGFTGNAYVECTLRPTVEPGCTTDDECPPTEVCRNRQCLDPCAVLNPCAPNAECQVLNRRTDCSCPPGRTGNPHVNCYEIPLEEPECRVDPDCTNEQACIKEVCVDPCLVEEPCGRQALCRTNQHRPICYCPEGWAGNPRTECFKPDCMKDDECPTDKMCVNQHCVDPCLHSDRACGTNAGCRAILHRAQCFCPPGTQGNPTIACVTVGCTSNDDCADDKACDSLNRVCIPVCEETTCAVQAECRAANHAALCLCPPPLTGNPFLQCYQVKEPVTDAPIEPECRQDSDCRSQHACINALCQNPCVITSPCLPSQECHVVDSVPLKTIMCQCPPDYIFVKEGICVRPEPECRSDSDCQNHEACREGTCVNVCGGEPCGLNAVCQGVNHRHQCQCAEGYTGDPNIHCKRMPPLVTLPEPDCLIDDDCSKDLSCADQRCVNPCIRENPCAKNAFCYTRDHRPVCRCPEGFIGDPQIECQPLTVPPEALCLRDSECPDSLACLGGQCVDPCSCGENAVCRVINHHAVCSCALDYDGDPYTACFYKGCTTDDSCPTTYICHNSYCIDPCHVNNPCAINAECFAVNREARCRCPTGLDGDPHVKCQTLKCEIDTDCPKDRTCQHGQCVDPCIYTTCADSAICTPAEHRGECRCAPGYRGDATFRCEPDVEPICTKDKDCGTGLACISEHCQSLCSSKVCGENAVCHVVESVPFKAMVCKCLPGQVGDAHTQCRLIPEKTGCVRDKDCAMGLACVGGVCRDPCNCGVNALCTVIKHRPICTCAQGYEGNPHIACSATGCTSNSQCPDDRACYNGNCVSPCLLDNPCSPRAECRPIAHKATCFCASGTSGDPLKECKVIGCSTNRDCPPDRACLNGRCLDQCIYNNTCAPNTECRSIDHRVECRCPVGFEGIPTVVCREKTPRDCRSDFDCESEYGCMEGRCQKPCQVLKPCQDPTVCTLVATRPLKTMTCSCPSHMVTSRQGQCVNLELPISVGCRADSECPGDQACLNTRCVTPCSCGQHAECYVRDHRPICTCLPGYQGNPNIGCYKAGCSKDEECPLDTMCSSGVCINPCAVKDPCDISAECYPENHHSKCRCTSGLEGDPYVRCQVIGCRSNTECPTDKACVNRQCVNPCFYDNLCAPNAECYVFQHTIGCRCPTDMPYGDPRFICEEKKVLVEHPKPECVADLDCPSKQACINEQCSNPCHTLSPCDRTAMCDVVDSIPVRTMICVCPEGFIMTDEGTCELIALEIPSGCRADSECPTEEACINRMCRIPCECGRNANCEIINHRSVCTCEVGFQGNPNIGCFPIGCQHDSECEDTQACYDGVCANPCLVDDPCPTKSECYAKEHRAYCRCPSGFQGDGYTKCLAIGCRANSECPSDRACINNICVDPCAYDPCSSNAECVIIDHIARCRCPPGMTGDPKVGCLPAIQPVCITDGDCPSQHACIDEKCVNPCKVLEPCHESAECKVVDTLPVRTMLCICADGEVTDEGGECEVLPPIKAACEVDPDCPSEKACFTGICKDPCQCGANADCEIVEHHPVCTCKRGYEGDPEIRCIEIGCYGNDDCPTTHACRNGQCAPVCGPNNEPCGKEAVCQGVNHEAVCYCPPGSRGNPRTQCIAIGCVSNDACPDDRSCINQRCESPCSLELCKEPATCHTQDHISDCPCPPGFNRTIDNGCEMLVIGCRSDVECPSKTVCINGKCIDPCGLDPCGENTECRVIDTVPVRTIACECLPGYQGDAAEKCIPTPVCPLEKGFILEDDDCVCPIDRDFYVDESGSCVHCPVELGYVLTEDGLCICDPEKGYHPTAQGTCDCPLPAVKDKDGYCVVRPDEPPIIVGCTTDDECPVDKMCNQTVCVPPCNDLPCAKYALCINANHKAICNCISGYSGDPYQKDDGCKPTFARTDFPRPDMLVNCLADGVQVDINVGDPGFNGVMYVKGYSKNEECRRVVKPDVDVGTIDFKVKFNTCGLIHENGLARFILVLQKHPKLVTYKAQAYHVKCTYNTGEKTITIGFNVSMLTTAGTIANTGPPPTCLMRITDPSGGTIDKAEIGDLLMLRIQVEPSNIYGGFARSCVALTANTDGTDNEHLVTDENGCATDPSIFGEWEQDDGEGKALVALFSAFKFPSSNSIRFQCNVRVCFGRCHPVNCNGYDAFGRRRRRQVEEDAEVLYRPESVYDGQLREIQVSSQAILTVESRSERFTAPENPENVGVEEVCVSKWGFIIALIITALLALVAVAVAVSCWLMAYRRRPKHGGPLPHPPEFPNPLFTTPEPLAEPSPDYLS